jgi:hypothetical protein
VAFEIHVDTERNRLSITLTGFASMDDVRRFDDDLRRAFTELPSHRGPHQLLYDVSGAKIQSQEVVNALRQAALHSPRTSAFALVNASALAGRQLSRIFLGAAAHVCQDRDAAVRWLDAALGDSHCSQQKVEP